MVVPESKIAKKRLDSPRNRLDTDELQDNIRRSFAKPVLPRKSSYIKFTFWDERPIEDTPEVERRAGQILERKNGKSDDPETEMFSAIEAVFNPEIEDEELVAKILEIRRDHERQIREKGKQFRSRLESLKKIRAKFQNHFANKKPKTKSNN